MKPSKWPGWLELGVDDPIGLGDLYQYKNASDTPDGNISNINYGKTLAQIAKESGYKPSEFTWWVYRKGPRVLSGNPHFAKELPLP